MFRKRGIWKKQINNEETSKDVLSGVQPPLLLLSTPFTRPSPPESDSSGSYKAAEELEH